MDVPEPQVILGPYLAIIWAIFKNWWWIILPGVLYFPGKALYRWWIQWEVWYKEQEWVVLEIIPPADVQKPFRAMEDVFNALWSIYDSANWRETWCEGELEMYPYWASFELASREGKVHYYLRIAKDLQKLGEAVLHTHFPDAEIFAAPDYTEEMPQDLPNKDYEVYGEDYVLTKDDVYPIRTYKFFEIKPEEIDKEKKLDPFVQLLEALTKLKKSENVWIQIIFTPIAESETPWAVHGHEVVDKLVKRPAKPESKSMLGEATRFVLYDKVPYTESLKEEAIIPPEMKLTPGEREIVAAVEEKISKYGFKTTIRAVYVYKKEARFAPHGRIFRAYCLHFNTQNLNGLRYYITTRTKIHYLFRKRRLYNRKRYIYTRYIRRLPPHYPTMDGKGTMILNAEELASLFHFPTSSEGLPPGVPRVAAKRAAPPPSLPIE